MSSRLITDGDRTYILEQLRNAPDSVLVAAFNQWHKERENALLCRETINVELGRHSFDDDTVVSEKSSAKFSGGTASTGGVLSGSAATGSDEPNSSRNEVSYNDPSDKRNERDASNHGRIDTSPGTSAIARIGSATRIDLLAMVKAGQQPHKKYEEHLKLMWQRGEVKFDGKEWWV